MVTLASPPLLQSHLLTTNLSPQGYANIFTNTTTYAPLYAPSPSSWSLVPALRHALTLYPHTPWFLSLSPHSLVTSPSLSIESHILTPLESLMLKDIPVVPPDSVIHTFSHLTTAKTSLILTQDGDNLAHGSFLLRNAGGSKESNDWAKFFLDTWFDPLYRSYNFQKAEGHALEHIVQWHPTILARLVLVPQRVLNSYNIHIAGKGDVVAGREGLWQEGDFLITFAGCETTTERNCQVEMDPYYEKWREEVRRLDAKDKEKN
jgi:mannan polymerase II complex MNN11 subunit